MKKIFVVNPGSTSTKIALFLDDKEQFSYNVEYDAKELDSFPTISDQLPYRMKNINQILEEHKEEMEGLSACVGRCGSVLPLEGGTYEASELMLEHSKTGINGVFHPAQLGGQIASIIAKKYNCPVYTVNPPEVDEFDDKARVTGIKGILRESHLHALNLKETAIRHSAAIGVKYEECNYIVCHLGGGISISAHKKGRMVDGNDIVKGFGPIAPTRCGSVPAGYLTDYIFNSEKTESDIKKLCTRTGGVVDLLGTSDMKKVFELAQKGEKREKLVWDAMVYSICKEIGAMGSALKGKVDAVLLSGGLVKNNVLVEEIKEYCEYIAPVFAYPGEFEMEAMANGVLRVLNGEEKARIYTGIPVFDPEKFIL